MWGKTRARWGMAALVAAAGLWIGDVSPSDAQNVESGVARSRGAAPASPSGPTGVRKLTPSIGGRAVVLVLDPDQCLLERGHPSDQRVYDIVEKGLSGQNELLLAAADCKQIPPWREGIKPTLDDFTQVQIGLQYRTVDLKGRETSTVREICAALKKHGETLLAGPVNQVRDRFNKMSDSVKLNETQFVGVVHEDDTACYASLLQKVRTDQGADKMILCVYAHVVVRGRLLYIYRYTEGDNYASMVRSTDLLRKSVQAQIDANR